MCAAEGSPFRPFLVLALTTGARRGELCALTWDAVDFERATVTIRQALGIDRRERTYFVKTTKTGRERVVSLSTVALEALRRVRASQAAEKLAAGASY